MVNNLGGILGVRAASTSGHTSPRVRLPSSPFCLQRGASTNSRRNSNWPLPPAPWQPGRWIEEIVQHFRGDTYKAFRGPSPLPNPDLLGEILPALQIEAVTVVEGTPAEGKRLRELNLRARTGATLLAVQRDGHMETIPPPEFQLQAKDLVILAGAPRQILNAVRLLEQPEESSPETRV
jgi:hypothetical protein